MVAVDAMGGDFAPQAVVEGAICAARKKIAIILFGDQEKLVAVLDAVDARWRVLPITIQHCTQVIEMADEPGRSVLKKGDSSLVRAVQAVADGQASVVVSAGNSGAALVAGMLIFGKTAGVLRPAIGGFLPTLTDSVFCIDLGANVDSKPEYLQQFALMGRAYVNLFKGVKDPKIGLLANGTELGKGTRLIQNAYQLLSQSAMQFIGNCEPMDVLEGKADVIVCEGFSGNIMLKSMEATIKIVMQWLKNEGSKSFLGRCVGLLGAPIFRRLRKNIKKAQRGGALLLGVERPLVIAHGASDAAAIEDAIIFAKQIEQQGFYSRFNTLLAQSLAQNTSMHLPAKASELKAGELESFV